MRCRLAHATPLFKIILTLLLFSSTGITVSFSEVPEKLPEVGIHEKLGDIIPMDIPFTDEQGRRVVLGELVTKPTVLSLVYYSCSHTCPLLLSGLAEVISAAEPEPGKDYSVVTISFDETDSPAAAAQKKNDYIRAARRVFPERSWNFLTGDKEAISKIAAATGFRFKRSPNGFSHPVGVMVISPQGKITRYLYGVRFLPLDLTLAITEASKGLAVPTVRKVLLYCYSYDPEGRHYVFNILKVTAAATLFFIALFIGWITLWGRKGRKEK